MVYRASIACLLLLLAQQILSAEVPQKPLLQMTIDEIFSDEQARNLARAATQGSLEEIERLVAGGADTNAAGAYGATPLYVAIRPGNSARFEKLLQLGGDPNVIVGRNLSVIHWAAYVSEPEFLELSLDFGGDPHLLAADGRTTPLVTASRSLESHTNNVKLLIDHGADIEYRFGDNGRTPVFVAATSYRYEHVYALILAGADTTKTWGLPDRPQTLQMMISRSGPGRFNTAEQTEYRTRVIEMLQERGELPVDFQ